MEKHPQLIIHQTLHHHSSYLGLPIEIFAFAMLLCLCGAGLLISVFGFGIGLGMGVCWTLLVLRPLQIAHRQDIHAWRLWLRTFQSAQLSAHLVNKKSVYVQTHRRTLTFQQWRKHHDRTL